MAKLRAIITLVLILVVAVSATTALFFVENKPANTITDSNFQDIVASVRLAMWTDINSGKASSGTVAIMDAGKIVYSEGFGMADRANSTPVDPNTRFNVGSVSKAFCAAAIMALVDDGKINLDHPVTEYVPDFTMADSRYHNITVRMLLDHSSGLPGTIVANDFGYELNPDFYQQVLTTLAQSHLKANPGEYAPYTNDGFSLAEIVVVRVSGQSYIDFVTQRILKPLSLDHTGLTVGTQTNSNIAAYYQVDTGKKVPAEAITLVGAGGLSSTAEDLARFFDSFSPGAKHVLSDASIAEMIKLQPSTFALRCINETGINPELSYGLGLDQVGVPYYQSKGIYMIAKGGDTEDFHSTAISATQQRISLAVIEAGHGSSAGIIARDTFNAILQKKGLLQEDSPAITAPIAAQAIPAHYASMSGFYAPNVNVEFNIAANTCTISLISNGVASPPMPLVYRDGAFYGPSGSQFQFVSVGGEDFFVPAGADNTVYIVGGQKLHNLTAPLTLSIGINGTQWLRRNTLPFESVNAPASYILTAHAVDGLLGYVDFAGVKQVQSATNASMPCGTGAVRDQTELTIVNKNGQNWVQVYDRIYSPISDVISLQNGANIATVNADGYNQWFKASGNFVLNFQKPAQDRVVVYSPSGSVIYDSIMSQGDVYAAQGSYVVFSGYAGDVITLTAK